MISLSHQFLFIHIPKTAGNAIQNILSQYSEERIVTVAPHQDGVERFEVRSDDYPIHKHSSLGDYREQLGETVIDSLFKFTCVRNPWDRMISFYFSPHRRVTTWNRDQFISLLSEVKPASDYLGNDQSADGETKFSSMDQILRFESLERDFAAVCEKIGIAHEALPVRNASSRHHYPVYYDDKLASMVAERFTDEIDFFGYRFAE